jgi:hypothetical protein
MDVGPAELLIVLVVVLLLFGSKKLPELAAASVKLLTSSDAHRILTTARAGSRTAHRSASSPPTTSVRNRSDLRTHNNVSPSNVSPTRRWWTPQREANPRIGSCSPPAKLVRLSARHSESLRGRGWVPHQRRPRSYRRGTEDRNDRRCADYRAVARSDRRKQQGSDPRPRCPRTCCAFIRAGARHHRRSRVRDTRSAPASQRHDGGGRCSGWSLRRRQPNQHVCEWLLVAQRRREIAPFIRAVQICDRTRLRSSDQQKQHSSVQRPRQDSNLRTRLRRPMLYPLSYEGKGIRS